MTLWEQIQLNIIDKQRYLTLLNGLKITLLISLFAVILGIALGLLLASMKLIDFKISFKSHKIKPLEIIADVYIDIIRGTPVVTQLLIFYFIIFKSGSPIFSAVIAFGMNSAAYVCEIIRAGILSIDKGQTEAGVSLGFTHMQTMQLIVIPQAVKNILPALANEFIVLIKETAAVGYISVADLTKAGQIIYSRTYSAFVPLISTAILYFIVVKALSTVFKKIEVRMRQSDKR